MVRTPTPETLKIAELIRTARERAELNQSELAKRLGIAAQSVQQWEDGKTSPSRKNMRKLKEVLRLDLPALIFGGGAKVLHSAGERSGDLNYALTARFPELDETDIVAILAYAEGRASMHKRRQKGGR